MAVLTQNVGRQDVEFHRWAYETLASRWQQKCAGETELRPVDLTGDVATFYMKSPSDEVLLELPCKTNDLGIARVEIPADTFDDAKWDTHKAGKWKMTVVHDEKTQLLGWGNYLLIN